MTLDQMLADIDDQSRGPLGTTNPVAKVTCPHCGGIMQAIDAKAHVATAARDDRYCPNCGSAAHTFCNR